MSTVNSQNISRSGYLQWGSVMAGSAVALAITLILIPFGHGIGFSMDTPLTKEKANGMILGIGMYLFFTQLISSIFGGYFAGKTINQIPGITAHESEFRDGTHGLLAWCVSTLLTAVGIAFVAFLASLTPGHFHHEVVNDPDLTRRASIIFSFAVAAGSLVSAIAAWSFATLGGDHRDTARDLSRHLSFRKNKRSQ